MIHRFETISSTNTYLKELAEQGAPVGTAVIARRQTGGRGRLGRSFHSPDGGLYLSFLLRPECEPSCIMHLTCAAAVAACDAVEAACGFRPSVKWTNDLIHGKRKLGGILTELDFKGSSANYAIIGIGINCTQRTEDFPRELQHMAASLSTVTGRDIDRNMLEQQLLIRLQQLSADILTKKSSIMARYRADCVTLGQPVSVVLGDACFHAEAIDLDCDGGLIIRTADGKTQTVSSGEVSIRGMYGYL